MSETRERPILFSGPMVRAILDGRKTQTRRLVKPQPRKHHWEGLQGHHLDVRVEQTSTGLAVRAQHSLHTSTSSNFEDAEWVTCPYGQPGDRLWAVIIKPVLGHDDRYGVGDDGHVYRIDGPQPRRMRMGTTSKGYKTVTLCRDGARHTASVHRLVCEAFYGPQPDWAHEVRHLDGNAANNRVENLDWGTRAQNWSDKRAARRGIHAKHPAARLTAEQVVAIRASTEPTRALARAYGVAQSTMQAVRHGKTWAEPPPAAAPNMPRWARRMTLEVVSVRVERLQAITEEDARAEGVVYTSDKHDARDIFEWLWTDINGAESWETNPWVWVVAFRRL